MHEEQLGHCDALSVSVVKYRESHYAAVLDMYVCFRMDDHIS